MQQTATQLKQRHRQEREAQQPALALRIHRALSWLEKAESLEDHDSQFIFLWIAFNAAYSQETGEVSISDGQKFNAFLKRIVELDTEKRIHQQLWQQFTQAIRVLLDNHYVYQPYWNHHNGIAGYDNWQTSFNKAKQAAQISIMKQDTAQVLSILFSRLYTLRNQIIHGGATYNSQVNRQQLKDATQILSLIVPIIIEIMMNNANQAWGEACYPVVD